MKVRHTLLGLALLLITVPLIAGGINEALSQPADQAVEQAAATQPVQQQQQQPIPAATAAPTTASASTSTISALGSVAANSVVELTFQTSGTIKGIYTEIGDKVEAGDIVADLDATDAWNTYNQAKLSLESAQLSMEQLMAPATDDEIAVAKANLASAQASYSSTANSTSADQIAQLQLKVQQAQDQLTALQTERANMNGSADQITLQEAKIGAQSFNLQIAQLNLQEAQTPNSSALYSASIKIQQAQLSLDKLMAAPTQAEIDSAQLKIDQAQAKVEDAQNALLKTQLVAPISGYVTAINSEAGDSVNSSAAVIEISDTSKLQMTVPVNELDVKSVTVGEAATVQLDALTGVNIEGTVDNVGWISSTSSDGIVTYDVRVVLNSTDERVRIGMTGEVAIGSGSSNS